ncbi:GNAT family N-acetyltransferase [Undibacterium sp. Jales W-56]|uniref:GNAT family N-acetyltransferase n=1 Tax=Undibacterium sp. Jales W-56 TaxID=2897325 RepID=UPI0021CF5294|nr:GNAT family protein [Undibacterium sp. Jales W-56]MCU6435634.1 GNAT family N-acetyltransferase [Undibacterium sp. Jales W-56]
MTSSSEKKSGDHFPELRTSRFILRQIVQEDIGNIFKGLSHPKVIAYYGISYDSLIATQEQIEWYRHLEQEQTGRWWAICPIAAPDQLIGACGLYEWDKDNHNADLGYWLHPDYWRQGVMQECLRSVLAHVFSTRQLHRIEAEVEPDNDASSDLLLKLGFQFEGRRREVAWKHQRYVDMDYYALLEPVNKP